MKLQAPIYLLRSVQSCWKCGSREDVIALAVERLVEDDGKEVFEGGEPFLLSNIEQLAQEVIDEVHVRHASFEKHVSKTAGTAYFMNICRCGAHFVDFFLHSEPGDAFFPETDQEATRITIEELPLHGQLRCRVRLGLGNRRSHL